MTSPANGANRKLRYIVIGAGMSGLLTAIKLKERGETDFVVYEKGDRVGGTWRENRYPGLACDTPAHSYAYSFALNPEWSKYYAPGPEIREYFETVARRYGLHDCIRFNTEIASCQWRDGRWRVSTTDGREDVADVIFAATGVLHVPSVPEIPGLSDFAGPAMHSARWDDAVALDGKRIAVIGSGSTGVQIVSALSSRAAKVVHLVRSAQWIMPCVDTVYSDDDRDAFRANPALIQEVRHGPDAAARRARFTSAIIDAESPELAEIQAICERNLEDNVRDPVLREKLRPNYRAACKRLVFSPDYYRAVQEPGVIVETTAIERIERNGVRLTDGTFHEVDVIALATGFKVDRFVRPMRVEGRDGLRLDDFWAKGPRAYLAVTVPGFPNFFLYQGPTGPVGNFSLIDIAENQWAYMNRLLDEVRRGACDAIEPSMAALEAYERQRNEAASRTVFASGCRSWYLDGDGVPQVWPWKYAYFVEVMSRPRFEDFGIVRKPLPA